MSDPLDNLNLWNAVSKTDPSATKHVGQRGGFTAIDAYSQIKAATEQFGPVGQGWGWEVKEVWFPTNGTVVVQIFLWHQEKFPNSEAGRAVGFDVFGQKKLDTSKGPDEDAFKKALTDAITKGLSYLGFNADVFMGKFDDNKYVELRKAEVSAESEGLDPVQIFLMLESNITKADSAERLKEVEKTVTRYRGLLYAHDADLFRKLGEQYESKKKEFATK